MTETVEVQRLPLWQKLRAKRAPLSFDLEITARCNNDCRHCYICLPAGDALAKKRELTAPEIDDLAAEAVSLGAVWVPGHRRRAAAAPGFRRDLPWPQAPGTAGFGLYQRHSDQPGAFGAFQKISAPGYRGHGLWGDRGNLSAGHPEARRF